MGKKKTTRPRPPRPAAWLEPTWSQLARRLAVAGGAGSAVLALLAQAPPHVAAGRGALVWLSILALFRLGAKALGSRPSAGHVDAEDVSGPPDVAGPAATVSDRRAA